MIERKPGARGLGRGLAALISGDAQDAAPGSTPADTLIQLPVDALRANPEQPRETFAPAALDALAASIRQHGVLTPVVARREGDGYVLIAGERRLRAARMVGLERIPVYVRGAPPTPAEQLELALIENLQREDLDPVESALGYQRLITQYKHTQEQVATRVGKDRATVANALRLLKLHPAGLDALKAGKISAGHARALLPVEDPEQFQVALATVLARELSVRATEQLVRSLKRPAPNVRRPDRTITRVGDQLTRTLGTRVALKPNAKGGGKIVIDYGGAEELDRLIGLIRG
jgi:ParB family chromosome partitioning protein